MHPVGFATHSSLVQQSVTQPARTSLALVVAPRQRASNKRARDDGVCQVKCTWSNAKLGQSHFSWNGFYVALKAEAKMHNVSQSGTLKEVLLRLRDHCKQPHPAVTRRAKQKPLSKYFTSTG